MTLDLTFRFMYLICHFVCNICNVYFNESATQSLKTLLVAQR